MIKRVCLALLVSLVCGRLHADDAAADTVTARTEAEGFSYSAGLGTWKLFNGTPLSYTPFEAGWAFKNGLRLQVGVDLFFYNGLQDDKKSPASGVQSYSYEMTVLRGGALYRLPLRFPLRPLAGITAESVQGQRRLAPQFVGGRDINATSPKIDAWGFLGCGVVAGAEWLITRDVSLQAMERYVLTFNGIQAPWVTQVSICVVL